jgi:hypothetical protein
MNPISNADRLARLLRRKLEGRAKAKAPALSTRPDEVRSQGIEAVSAITSKFARAGANDKQLRRSLVEQLLADQFGPKLANEAKFQQVIDQVEEMMATDPTIGPLLDRALLQIRERFV